MFARTAKALSFIAALALAMSAPALALMVRPVLVELASVGGGASGSLEVVNDRNRPMTVEVTVNRLVLPQRGEPMITKTDGADFMIFPTIAQIQPGARQIFRVRYVGKPDLAESQLYTFATTELPVTADPNDQRAQVQVLYSINSVVAVRPVKGQPDIKAIAAERGVNAKGVPGIYVTFENDGPAHGYVTNGVLELRSGSWNKKFDSAQLGNAFGIGLIPPNAKRDMFVPVSDAPASGVISADIKIQKS